MRENVLVIGGSCGIGEGIVRELSQSYSVSFTYNSSKENALKICEDLKDVSCFKCDVRFLKSVQQLEKDFLAKFKHVDHLVYCAGIAEYKLFVDINESDWLKMMDINLNGFYRVLSCFSKHMLSEHSGSVVGISSVWGQVGASMESHYAASKAGMIGLINSLAKEFSLSNVRVNGVCPGAIQTKMLGGLSPSDLESLNSEIPLGRVGTPQEVAESVSYLLSAKYVTGECLCVDGGLTL